MCRLKILSWMRALIPLDKWKTLPKVIKIWYREMELVRKLTEKEKDYAAYVSLHTNAVGVFSVFSGFIFTAITIILTLHPEPSQISVQITLFILSVVQDTFGVMIVERSYILQLCVRIAPELPEAVGRWNPIYLAFLKLSWTLLQSSIISMFFLWNLPYLALVSGLVAASFIVFAYVSIIKPIDDHLKKQPWIRK